MTEHKFTDEEIIKALECCSSEECEKCEYEPHGDCYRGSFACNDDLMRTALDLIKRQKAEIRAYDIALKFDAEHYREEIVQLKAEVAYWMDAAANAKKEAVGAFAERLKKYYASLGGETAAGCVEYHVDQIAKEMMGEQT